MDIETVETVAETQTQAAGVPVVEEQAQATDAAAEGQPGGDAAEKQDERDRELARLRRALTKRDRTQGAMHRELEELRQLRAQVQPQQQPAEQGQQVDPQEIVRFVEDRAARIAEARKVAEVCNTVHAEGVKKYPDFADALKAVHEEVGGLFDAGGSPTPIMGAILEADKPAALIHYLGKHPEIAAELDGMTPTKAARKLAAIEAAMNAKPQPSQASRTLQPLRANGAQSELSTSMDFRTWEKLRNEQERARRGW